MGLGLDDPRRDLVATQEVAEVRRDTDVPDEVDPSIDDLRFGDQCSQFLESAVNIEIRETLRVARIDHRAGRFGLADVQLHDPRLVTIKDPLKTNKIGRASCRERV